jgi:hypothetical protein
MFHTCSNEWSTTMSASVMAENRTGGGRFAPGHSGNPAGRPKGARNRATLLAEALLDENAPELMRKLIDGALEGDRVTARFLTARLCPIRTDQPVTLEVAPRAERNLVAVHAAMVRALCDGEITPKEALAIARVLAIGAKLRDRAHRVAKERRRAEQTPRAAAPAAARPKTAPPPAVAAPKPARAAAPVPDLYSARAASPASARGLRPARSDAALRPGPLPAPGEGGGEPVSDLYFPRAA